MHVCNSCHHHRMEYTLDEIVCVAQHAADCKRVRPTRANVGTANANGSTSACDAAEHVAISGVSIAEWAGGNMPEVEEMVYKHTYKKSGFTVLAFTILTFAFTWGMASVISGAMGAAGVGAGFSALTAASISAGVYAGAMALNGAGLTTAQSGWAGSTGNGVLNVNIGSLDKHQRNLVQATRNLQIGSRVGTGLQGAKTLYAGNCPENMTVAQCQTNGYDAGTMHRSDVYRETNTTLQLVEREADCVTQFRSANATMTNSQYEAAYLDESTGVRKWVQQCIAPDTATWATGY